LYNCGKWRESQWKVNMAVPPVIQRMIDAEREQHELEIERLRGLSDEEKGKMVSAVCRLAAAIVEGRKKSGFAPPVPTPWPDSTWELLRRLAGNGHRS
jgi:hypothetical protein